MTKRLLLALVLFLAAHAFAGTCSSTTVDWQHNSGVSAAVNTTGKTLIVAAAMHWTGAQGQSDEITISDNQNNVWQYASDYQQTGSSVHAKFYFVPNPTTSASHTFTVSGTNYPSMVIFYCDSTATRLPLYRQNGNSNLAVNTFQTGSVTPLEAGDLVIAVAATDGASTSAAIDSGFSTPVTAANGMASAAYLYAASTSALNPQWTLTSSNCDTDQKCATSIAVFRASTASALPVAGWQISTPAGNTMAPGSFTNGTTATAAPLNWPGKVAFDASGNEYFAVVNDNRIAAICNQATTCALFGQAVAPGKIVTVAGTGVQGCHDDTSVAAISSPLGHPSAVDFDAQGRLYIVDQQCNRVRRVALDGTMTTFIGSGLFGSSGCGSGGGGTSSGWGGLATSATLTCPQSMFVDKTTGYVYVSDTNWNVVDAVNTAATTQTIFNVSICTLCIDRIFGTGAGSFGGDGGQGRSAYAHWPLGIAITSAGKLLIADLLNHCIRGLTSAGVASTFAGTCTTAGYSGDSGLATSATLNGPSDVAVCGTETAIADTGNNLVRWVYANSNIATIAGIYAIVGNGSAVAYSGGYNGDSIPANLALLQYPLGVTFDSGCNVHIGDLFNNRVRKVTLSGTASASGGVTVKGGVTIK